MITIGVQAMMLKQPFADDGVFLTLKAMRALGYRTIEVSQVPMTANVLAELTRAQDELGVDIAALSCPLTVPKGAPFDSLTDDFDKIVGDAARLSAQHLRIGIITYEALESRDALLDFCATIEGYGSRLADKGLTLSYHNHHIDFMRFEGEYILDIIAERCPHVSLEIDVHWVQRGGLDPVRTLAKYGTRVKLLHLKDFRIGHVPAEAFDDYHAGDALAVHQTFQDLTQFAEVGEGSLDFPGILAEAENIGIEYAFVEQDRLYGRTPLEALALSHDNLVRLGFADRF